jgi:hypothetical protein
VLRTDEQQIPLAHVQDVDMRQTLIQKPRSVGDVVVHVTRPDGISIHLPFDFDINGLIDDIKDTFNEGVAGDSLTSAAASKCANETKARADGYATGFTGQQTLYWCFGLENGQRVLKVVNRRRYPLSLSHTGLKFIGYEGLNLAGPALARSVSGPNTLLLPFQEAMFSVNLQPGQTVSIHTQFWPACPGHLPAPGWPRFPGGHRDEVWLR